MNVNYRIVYRCESILSAKSIVNIYLQTEKLGFTFVNFTTVKYGFTDENSS